MAGASYHRPVRVLVAAVAALFVLATAPAAQAMSATLTAPADGAVYYTGAGSASAQVVVTASRDLSGCTNGPGTSFNVVFKTLAGAAAGGPNSTQDSISTTSLVQPGDYKATANFVCGGSGGDADRVEHQHLSCDRGSPPIISDRDLDGVTDSVDQCPDVPGVAANSGCPVFDAPAPVLAPAADKDDVPADKDKCDDANGWDGIMVVPVAWPAAPKRKSGAANTGFVHLHGGEASRREEGQGSEDGCRCSGREAQALLRPGCSGSAGRYKSRHPIIAVIVFICIRT